MIIIDGICKKLMQYSLNRDTIYLMVERGRYLSKDIKHFLVNLGTTLTIFIFYHKFGFIGWPHLLSVILIHYAVLPLDDWLEKERPFPYYVVPMLAYTLYHFPAVTVLALLGDLVVNLRALININSFVLERLEGLGNVLIYVIPITLPFGINNIKLYLAASLYILFTDSFHKIGHRETSNTKLMWINGLFFLGLVSYIFATPNLLFVILLSALLISLLPFKLIKSKLYSWAYSQGWFGFVSFIGFYYYLNYVI